QACSGKGPVLCSLWVDTVEKVVSDPPKRNNRIRTARYLNRNCVRGRDFESMLRIQGRKIVFQQYRSKSDICIAPAHVHFTPESGHSAVQNKCPLCAKSRHSAVRQRTSLFDYLVREPKSSLQPQRGNNHDDADRRDVPDYRTGQRKVRGIQKRVDKTTPKVQVCSPHRKPVVSASCRDDENGGDEERERLGIVLECSLNPPGDTGERSTRLFSRTGGPTIAAAPALKVRDDNDMHDSDKDAGRE